MNKLLFNSQRQLRNGWWIVIFIALIALTRLIYPSVSGLVKNAGVTEQWISPLSFLFVLLVTWVCMKLRQQTLADVGLALNRRWLNQFSAGLAIGGIQIVIIIGFMLMFGGVEFKLNTNPVLSAVMLGLYGFLFAALLEELLFRGFIFQRLIAGLGVWWAQIIMATLFTVGHLTNPEVNQETIIWVTLDIALGAILWGLAYIKTGSLALPVGLHLGWNWIQGNGFGFAVSGYDHQGIFVPVLTEQPAWITGAGFGPEATVFAVVVDVAMILILWRWRGTKITENKTETTLYSSQQQTV